MATETKLKLEAPEVVQTVQPADAAGLVPLKAEERSQLEVKVDAFVDDLVATDANSPNSARKSISSPIWAQGDRRGGRPFEPLPRPAGQGDRQRHRHRRGPDGPQEDGRGTRSRQAGQPVHVAQDPGIIPFGNKLNNYFQKYQSSQTHISKILGSLASGKDELLMDNAAIDVERSNMWKTMGRLEQMIHISKTMDAKLEEKANELDATDPAKAKAIRETALFYTRQRTTDLLTQMAVTVQGYLALDLVKKNNVELVKGVDRASTTTVAALRTAVTVAQALTNQRLVLDQITALNTTTANMIDRTGELLKSQTGDIHKQAASSTIPLETLQRAFQNIYDTMDTIDRFKVEALGNMKQTVNVLTSEVEKSRGYIARAEGVEQNRLAGSSSTLTALEG
jgi:hypothetical protein